MTNRKLLYGYKIQDGGLSVVMEEAAVVSRVYSLYAASLSYQKISDTLNEEHIPYSRERPEWNKHKVKRLLENPRYIGRDGYPAIVDDEMFQTVQAMIQEKTAGYDPRPDRPALRLKDCMRCAQCGGTLHRLAGKGRRADMLYLKCVRCAAMVTIADAGLLDEVARQWAKHKASRQEPYQPSSEVIRLTNAINRGLEHPESPEEVVSLILQGASARYDCCPAAAPYENADRPLDVDELLETLGLYEHQRKLPNQLSGGQQQRTAIGRAIVKNPDILLCDEPTGALDYNTSKEILKLIETVNHKYGNTIVMVTHNDAIKDMADRVVKLRDGMIRRNYQNEQKIPAADLEW